MFFLVFFCLRTFPPFLLFLCLCLHRLFFIRSGSPPVCYVCCVLPLLCYDCCVSLSRSAPAVFYVCCVTTAVCYDCCATTAVCRSRSLRLLGVTTAVLRLMGVTNAVLRQGCGTTAVCRWLKHITEATRRYANAYAGCGWKKKKCEVNCGIVV